MIEKLTGRPVKVLGGNLILDVHGVGYGVEMPPGDLAEVGTHQDSVEVWVHTHVREGAIKLYGFLAFEARLLFDTCVGISGVGPKLALAMVGTLGASALVGAVYEENTKALEAVPGIGNRQSKKILFELKPKLEKLASEGLLPVAPSGGAVPWTEEGASDGAGARKGAALPESVAQDLRTALINLGYKEKEINPVIKRLGSEAAEKPLEELIKLALAELTGARQAGGRKAADEALTELF